jgi:uncharacterized protein YkwD
MATPIVVWAAIGGSAGAAVAHDASVSAGGVRFAAASPHARTRTHPSATRKRSKSASCTTPRTRSRARQGAKCRAATRPSVGKAPRATPPRLRPTSTKATKATPSAGEATAAQAGVIAKVLATPCQNTQLTPEPGNLGLVRAAVLCLINTERAQNGEEPLATDPRLQQAAESHGREMISADYFDHVSPSGVTPVDRIRTTGYIPNAEVGYVIGENLAWGTLSLSTPQAIVNAWIASPEHLANILEGKYRDTGIDVEPEVPAQLSEGVAGALYTQEFGVIVH